MSDKEPHNPFYLALLLSCVVFVATALAYAVIPTLEEKAIQAGEIPPPSLFRDELRQNGWRWLLYEVAVVIAFSFAGMGLDRLRRLQKERSSGTIPPNKPPTAS